MWPLLVFLGGAAAILTGDKKTPQKSPPARLPNEEDDDGEFFLVDSICPGLTFGVDDDTKNGIDSILLQSGTEDALYSSTGLQAASEFAASEGYGPLSVCLHAVSVMRAETEQQEGV